MANLILLGDVEIILRPHPDHALLRKIDVVRPETFRASNQAALYRKGEVLSGYLDREQAVALIRGLYNEFFDKQAAIGLIKELMFDFVVSTHEVAQ